MRTRRSNKTKSFFQLVLADDGDSADESFAARDGAESEASGGGSERDDDDDDDQDEEAGGFGRKRRPAAVAKRRTDYHELPVYPHESRILTRVYTGELQRHAKYSAMRDLMYGPEYEPVKLIWSLWERWIPYPVLPPRFPPKHPRGVLPSPWMPPGFEVTQEEAACRWYCNYRADQSAVQRSRAMIPKDGQELIPCAKGDLVTLLGPWHGEKEHRLKQGDGMILSPSNLPIDDPGISDRTPTGSIFDVGGLVLALDWGPTAGRGDQVLALAVIPHSDQTVRRPGAGNSPQEEGKGGSIQFWGVAGEKGPDERLPRPSRRLPKFLAAKCFDWGRPKRLQWCPISLGMAGICGMLAVLCGDGKVRVIEVEAFNHSADATHFDWVESPIATLGATDDYNIQATCFTWVGANRLALGHSDGTVTLWSLYPCQLLQRHAVHASFVIDISSAYPSHPYLVASVPVGGFTTLTDLSQPSAESTYVAAPAVALQPGLLSWNDLMQGWVALYPSSSAGATTLAFIHARYFCQPRTTVTFPGAPISVSAAGPHPFVLVGCADGSLWSYNALTRLFKLKDEQTDKIKIAEHEFRAPDALGKGAEGQSEGLPLRGASRILQGFLPVLNDEPRAEQKREFLRKKKSQKGKTKSGKRKGRPPKNPPPEGNEVGSGAGDDDDSDFRQWDSRFVIHDPLTRVTAVAWNPNPDFGCWAAVAVGSGLVRVMDLGVE